MSKIKKEEILCQKMKFENRLLGVASVTWLRAFLEKWERKPSCNPGLRVLMVTWDISTTPLWS